MKKLAVKDLINAGLFSVLMIATTWIAGMIGFIPVMMPVMPFAIGILSGPVFMLFSTKINKFGMIMVMSVVYAIVFGSSGHGIYIFVGVIGLGFICEMIMKSGEYKSINKARLTYTVFMAYAFLNFIPLIVARDVYLAKLLEQGYTQEFVDTMAKVMPTWAAVPVTIGGCIGGFIGCTIGIKMLKKHFERANMV